MILNFATALSEISPDSVVQMATERRAPSNYLFATILPELPRPTYTVESGTLSVKPTMAGMVGMDSPYPAGGYISVSQFLEETAKFGIEVSIPERTTRELQAMLAHMGTEQQSKEAIANEALEFFDSVILAALIDRDEWMRGQALTTGAIAFTFNGINLAVDYGLPAENTLTARTIAGTDAYHLAGSAFWTDVREAERILRPSRQVAAMLHSTTLDVILSQAANNIEVLSDENGVFRLARYIDIGGNTMRSSDARDRVTLIVYDEEGEAIPTDATPAAVQVPFLTPGKIVWVGSGNNTGYRVGQGSGGGNPQNELEVGYTHIAPTVEGGGRPGRWGELYTPERAPWQLTGRAAENSMPVIEAPERIVIASTEMP